LLKNDIKATILLVISCSITLCGLLFVCLNPDHIWETVTGVATVWLVLVAYTQFGDSNRTSRATFIRQFSDHFFSENTRDIVMLLELDALELKEKPKPIQFVINASKVSASSIRGKDKERLIDKGMYSEHEIDDWLLAPLEDIGYFEENGLIKIDEIYNHFDFYIYAIIKNTAIKKYVGITNEHDSRRIGDVYFYMVSLARKLCAYRETTKPLNNSYKSMEGLQ
jgi:hypothetical protein